MKKWVYAALCALAAGLGLLYHFGLTAPGGSSEGREVQLSDTKVGLYPLQFPDSAMESMMIRAPASANPKWTPANQADTATPGIYEIKIDNARGLNRKESLALIETARETARKNGWSSFEKGIRDGFYLQHDIDPLHYIKQEHMGDDETLNPEKPEALMYYPTPEGMVLAGVMFLANKISQIPTQLAIDGAHWHFHRWVSSACWVDGLPEKPDPNGHCPEGAEVSDQSPLMLHVWFVDHPEGPFATEMCLPDGVLKSISGTDSLKKAMSLRPVLEQLQRQSESDTRDTISQQLTED